MKYFILFLFIVSGLFAKSVDECYSVQIKSFYIKKDSLYDFSEHNYPASCKLIKIGNIQSVRCGCYDDYDKAKRALERLSEEYYDAIIVNTYKKRFQDDFYDDDKEEDVHQKEKEDEIDLDDVEDDMELDNDSYLEKYGYK